MMSHLTLTLVVVMATVAIIQSAPVTYRSKPAICNATETFWISKCAFCQCTQSQAPMCQSVECGYDLGAPTACPRYQMVADPNGGCCDVCPAGAGEAEEEIEEQLEESQPTQPPTEEEVEGTVASPNAPTQPPTEEEVEETVAAPNAPTQPPTEEEVEETVAPPNTMPIHSGPKEDTVAPPKTTPITVPVHNGPEEEVEGTIAPPNPTKTPSSTIPLHNNPGEVVEGTAVTPSALPTTTSSVTTSQKTTTPTSRNAILGCKFLFRDVRPKFSFTYLICSLVLKIKKMNGMREPQFWHPIFQSKLRRIRRETAEQERLVSHKK